MSCSADGTCALPAASSSSAAAAEAAEAAALARANALIDMHAPLVWQMWKLSKAEYLPWVHDPFSYVGTAQRDARLFGWGVLEPLTKTSWWVVPLVWLPLAALFAAPFLASPAASAGSVAAVLAAGLALWTLLEYAVHRFVFHLDALVPDAGAALVLHFLLHGIHHKIPMDRYRLVMPPVLFAGLAALGYAALAPAAAAAGAPPALVRALFAAVLLGYVCYDMVHYSQHHVHFAKGSYLARMKTYHMKHHYSGQQDAGFGITSTLWDVAFGTLLDVRKDFARRADGRDEATLRAAIDGGKDGGKDE